MGLKQWLVILLTGMLLAVIALPSEKKEENAPEAWTSMEQDRENMTEKEKLETDLEELLSGTEGVGKVRVLLTVKEEKEVFSGTEQVLSVTGVLISAEGGDNPVVIRNIQQAVMALFQVEAHKIKVMKMK
ncbi:MAG: hypothetical protein Q4E89_00920 [Eubacteriales bacterium]|nr:hypothetical protein [Eubacteriales bacterium]